MKDDKTRVGSGWQLDDPTPPKNLEELALKTHTLICQADQDGKKMYEIILSALTSLQHSTVEEFVQIVDEIETSVKNSAGSKSSVEAAFWAAREALTKLKV